MVPSRKTTNFPQSYFRPEEMRFASSDALFPSGDLRTMLASEYAVQCRVLCSGEYPSWEEVEACFLALKVSL